MNRQRNAANQAHVGDLSEGIIIASVAFPRASEKRADHARNSALTLDRPASNLAKRFPNDRPKTDFSPRNWRSANAGGASYGKFDDWIYCKLSIYHPVDLCEYQVGNSCMLGTGLINSGGAAGKNDWVKLSLLQSLIRELAEQA